MSESGTAGARSQAVEQGVVGHIDIPLDRHRSLPLPRLMANDVNDSANGLSRRWRSIDLHGTTLQNWAGSVMAAGGWAAVRVGRAHPGEQVERIASSTDMLIG